MLQHQEDIRAALWDVARAAHYAVDEAQSDQLVELREAVLKLLILMKSGGG
jgi:hypothetical protein